MTTYEQMEANQRALVRILRDDYDIEIFSKFQDSSPAVTWVTTIRYIETKLEKILESLRSGEITPLQVAHLWAFPYEEKKSK